MWRAPRTDAPLTHFVSPRGEKCGLACYARACIEPHEQAQQSIGSPPTSLVRRPMRMQARPARPNQTLRADDPVWDHGSGMKDIMDYRNKDWPAMSAQDVADLVACLSEN